MAAVLVGRADVFRAHLAIISPDKKMNSVEFTEIAK